MTASEAAVERLARWEQFGGAWRVVDRGPHGLTVALCRCDGGEEIERFTSDNAALAVFIGDRTAGP